MTYDYGTGQPYGSGTTGSTGTPTGDDASRTEAAKAAARDAAHTAKDEAAGVAASVKESGTSLAAEAKTQAKDVTAEVKAQAADVLRASREEMTAQAAAQQQKAAGSLRAFSGELSTMADSSEGGMAGDLTRQLADRVGGVAAWLDEREPGELLDEVKTFARNRPGTFLAIAAGAGLLAGRLTRGIKDAPSAEDTTAAGYVGGSSGTTGVTGTSTGTSTGTGASTGTGTSAYTAAGGYSGAPGTTSSSDALGTSATSGTTGAAPVRTSAFAGAATGATYGASSDDTAVYGTGPVSGGTSAESSHWDDAVAQGSGTAEGNPLSGVQNSSWADTASAPGYGTDHMEGSDMSINPETPERHDNPGAYGGGAENVPVENETYGENETGEMGGGTSEVPEHQAHQAWSPVHEKNREEDHR